MWKKRRDLEPIKGSVPSKKSYLEKALTKAGWFVKIVYAIGSSASCPDCCSNLVIVLL